MRPSVAAVLGLLIGIAVSEVVVPWWTNAVYYRVLVDSFKDSNGDGLGDLKGLTKQISYVKAIGGDAVILSPINDKSKDCSKPGNIDYIQIDQRYGDLQDFNTLIEKSSKLNIKVVITLLLQSISEASHWFTSSSTRANGFEDWLVWRDGTSEEAPLAEDGVEKWVWNEDRKAYWASTDKEALLNLCSDYVASLLSSVVCAWIRRGIAGVLLNPDFITDINCGDKILRKIATQALICARTANFNDSVILVESSLPSEISAMYYKSGANSVFSTSLISPSRLPAPELAVHFLASLLYAPEDSIPSWITSSANSSRIVTRFGSELVDTVNLISLTLPGAAVIQQGDELGMADGILEWATETTNCWPSKPIASAAPFAWDESENGGFTSGDPWLPPSPNHRYANAKTEFSNDFSHVAVVRTAAAMRKSPAIGPYAEIKRLGDAIAILRWGGPGTLLLVSNTAKDPTEVNLAKVPGLPIQMTVAISSAGSRQASGSHINVDSNMKLSPGESVLLAGAPRHCAGPGPVDRIANKLTEGWQKINKYFGNI